MVLSLKHFKALELHYLQKYFAYKYKQGCSMKFLDLGTNEIRDHTAGFQSYIMEGKQTF